MTTWIERRQSVVSCGSEDQSLKLDLQLTTDYFQEEGVPKINLEIPHQLSAEDSRSRLERFTDGLPKDQVSDLEQSWSGDTLSFAFKTFGIKIAGNLTAADEKLLVDLDIPFSAMMFKGKIESEIKKQLERLTRS